METRVRDVIADTLGVDVDDLSRGVSLAEDLAVDSLDLADLAAALDTELGVILPDAVFDGMRTCDELVDAVETLLNAEAARP